jgi:hypothetical protein
MRVPWSGLLVLIVLAQAAPGRAQSRPPAREPSREATKPTPKEAAEEPAREAGSVRVYRFDDLDVDGNVKAPQLLYFLKRVRNRFRSFRLPDPDLTQRTLETRDADFL